MIYLTPEMPLPGPWGVHLDGGYKAYSLCIQLLDNKIPITWAIFTPTGSETQEKLDQIAKFRDYLLSRSPHTEFVVLRASGQALPEWCLSKKQLPTSNQGLCHCAFHWKIQCRQEWLKQQGYPEQLIYGHTMECRERLQQLQLGTCATPEQQPIWIPQAQWGINSCKSKEILEQTGLACSHGNCLICPRHPGCVEKSALEKITQQKYISPELLLVCSQDLVLFPLSSEIGPSQKQKGCHNAKRIPWK